MRKGRGSISVCLVGFGLVLLALSVFLVPHSRALADDGLALECDSTASCDNGVKCFLSGPGCTEKCDTAKKGCKDCGCFRDGANCKCAITTPGGG